MRATLDRVRRNGDDGFTLIELLIVIVILGVLAAIVVFSVQGINNKSDKVACQSTVSEVDTAYEAYVADGHPSATTATNVSALGAYFHGSTAPTTVTDKNGNTVTLTTVAAADGLVASGGACA